MQMLSQRSRGLFLLLLVIVVAAGSAAVGAFVASRSIDQYARQLEQILPVQEFTRVQLPRVEDGVSSRIQALQGQLEGTVLPVVRASDPVHAGGVYARRGAVLYATALTTDGWLVVPEQLEAVSDLRVLGVDEAFPIEEVELDAGVGVRFLKTALTGVPIGSFGPSESVRAGDQVFVVTPTGIAARTVLDAQARKTTSVLMESGVLDRRFELDQAVDRADGALVVDASGAFIGLLVGETDVIPMHYVVSGLDAVLAGDAPEARPDIGLTYTDLSRVVDGRQERGWRVERVTRGGLADKAGIVAGDRIVRVNGADVSGRILSELVALAEEGTVLRFQVVHADLTEQEISVTL